MMKKVVFLYSELAGYTVACLAALSERDVDIHVVRWPVNKEAPFQFEFPDRVNVIEKPAELSELTREIKRINPDVIYSSGWMDKDYVRICAEYRNRIPVIVGFDNQWEGKLRQRIAKLMSKKLVHSKFTHAWVPGVRQKEYAKRLGFREDKILTGLYSADTPLYEKYYLSTVEKKKRKFPKRFLYVGRYIRHKGIDELWNAFSELRKENKEWELWCVGTGELYDQRPELEGVVHKGFVQPQDFEEIIENTGVFVLPSHFEPWGVVLHEFAMAGFPLIATKESGASTAFINEPENGFVFKGGNESSLLAAMKRITERSDEELMAMGEKSRLLAKTITPDLWADQLMSVI